MLITTVMCRQRTAKVYLYHDKDTQNATHMKSQMRREWACERVYMTSEETVTFKG